MCVILIGRVTKALHDLAKQQNGDGFSLFNEKGLVKSPTEAQVKKALNKFGIWHYRIATSGEVSGFNIHPFPICNGKYYLYHNGVLGDGLGDMSDTHALASLLQGVKIEVADSVVQSLSTRNRFVIVNANDVKDFRLYGAWEAEAGILLSHKMYTYKTGYAGKPDRSKIIKPYETKTLEEYNDDYWSRNRR